MNEMAIFTEEIALELLARGFKLKGITEKAWLFEDSVLLERTVSELTAALMDKE